MQLTIERAYELVTSHGVFARDCCDKCGRLLGAVRFTRQGETGEWCSRECRGDAQREVVRKGGRPRKYRTDRARVAAERLQNAERQRSFRVRSSRNGKPPCSLAETNHLQAQKSPLSTTPLTQAFCYETYHTPACQIVSSTGRVRVN
jgi:hypothetical protein